MEWGRFQTKLRTWRIGFVKEWLLIDSLMRDVLAEKYSNVNQRQFRMVSWRLHLMWLDWLPVAFAFYCECESFHCVNQIQCSANIVMSGVWSSFFWKWQCVKRFAIVLRMRFALWFKNNAGCCIERSWSTSLRSRQCVRRFAPCCVCDDHVKVERTSNPFGIFLTKENEWVFNQKYNKSMRIKYDCSVLLQCGTSCVLALKLLFAISVFFRWRY